MKVTLKLLATYRQNLPAGTPGTTCEIQVPTNAQADTVLAQFNIPIDRTTVILVNGSVPTPGQKLQEGDVLCAFPAMAGG